MPSINNYYYMHTYKLSNYPSGAHQNHYIHTQTNHFNYYPFGAHQYHYIHTQTNYPSGAWSINNYFTHKQPRERSQKKWLSILRHLLKTRARCTCLYHMPLLCYTVCCFVEAKNRPWLKLECILKEKGNQLYVYFD